MLSGGQNQKCYLTPTISGGQKRAKWQHHPDPLGPTTLNAGTESEVATCRNRIRSGCLTGAVSVAQKSATWLHHPCHLRGPKHSTQGQNQKRLPNPTVSGAPKRAKWQHNPCRLWVPNTQRGDGIRTCYVTCAISGAQSGQSGNINPAALGSPGLGAGRESETAN